MAARPGGGSPSPPDRIGSADPPPDALAPTLLIREESLTLFLSPSGWLPNALGPPNPRLLFIRAIGIRDGLPFVGGT
jgi:hypothetical protein